MKKSALVATFLVSTFACNGFAADQETPKEVTVRELVSECATLSFEALLMFLCLEYPHHYIKPENEKSSVGQTFDQVSKAFFGILIGDQAKTFFQKLKAFTLQKSKPLVSPVLETVKNVF